jgi:uncharacterized membrane protein
VRSPDPRRLRNWIVVGACIAAITAVVVAYPYFLKVATLRFGVSGAALALLALVAGSLAISRQLLSGPQFTGALRSGAAPTLGIPLLLLAAAFTGELVWMQLAPCLVYLTLAELFRASLRAEASIIEMGARWLVPETPDFVRSYCRKVTALWVGFFAGSAVLIAALAVSGAQAWWELYTGQLVYASMMAISAVEFFVRKTWFRYYFHMGPFDRLWSTLFPAQNTPQGRRSEAYIRLFKPDR